MIKRDHNVAWYLYLGRMPADVKTRLTAEGIILYAEESVCQTAIFNDFRAPGIYYSYRRQLFIGYFALTE